MSGSVENGYGMGVDITGAKDHGSIQERVIAGNPDIGKTAIRDIDGIGVNGRNSFKILLKRIAPLEAGLFQLKAINICYYCSYFFSGNYHHHRRFCFRHQLRRYVLHGV